MGQEIPIASWIGQREGIKHDNRNLEMETQIWS